MSPAASGTFPDPRTARACQAREVSATENSPLRTGGGRRALVRRMDTRVVAGVAGGIADHLDVPVLLVRAIFAVLAGSGIGFLAYIALWVLVPVDVPGEHPLLAPHGPRRRSQMRTLVGYAAVAIVVSGVLGIFGSPFGGGTLGPLTLAGVGALLIWRRTSADQRERWTSD